MQELISSSRTAGGLWAVQAKAYDPAYSVSKADVDTFLSESSRAEFSYRLLIATTNRVGHTARRNSRPRRSRRDCLLLADLEAARGVSCAHPLEAIVSGPTLGRPPWTVAVAQTLGLSEGGGATPARCAFTNRSQSAGLRRIDAPCCGKASSVALAIRLPSRAPEDSGLGRDATHSRE